MSRLRIVALVTIAACRDPEPREISRPGPLETGIARDLTARFGTPVTTACAWFAGIPVRCESELADGTKIPIAVTSNNTEWAWRVDARVVASAALVEVIAAALEDLRVRQTIDCGARVLVVRSGERIACALGGGGLAFVSIGEAGQTSLELALDAASAAARGELVTPDREQALVRASRRLELLAGESDGEDELVDGGVASPPDGEPASEGGAPDPAQTGRVRDGGVPSP